MENKKIDTYYKNTNVIKLVFDSFIGLITSKHVIVLLSGNGMRVYFPILYFLSTFFGKKIYHNVIGGNLDTYVIKYPKFKKYLNSFDVNWVETQQLISKMNDVGVTNVQLMPNFKRLNVVNTKNIKEWDQEKYSFCMFARVMKEKGVEDAIDAINDINRSFGQEICYLDIYGAIDVGYAEQFEILMKKATPTIRYGGKVTFDRSVETIKDYYALHFPTYWKGEGFPGTIIDAFSAGVPVIATDWNCNSEIIDNWVNGVIYPNKEVNSLKDSILWFVNNPTEVNKMKEKCVDKAYEYQPDKYIEIIKNFIES